MIESKTIKIQRNGLKSKIAVKWVIWGTYLNHRKWYPTSITMVKFRAMSLFRRCQRIQVSHVVNDFHSLFFVCLCVHRLHQFAIWIRARPPIHSPTPITSVQSSRYWNMYSGIQFAYQSQCVGKNTFHILVVRRPSGGQMIPFSSFAWPSSGILNYSNQDFGWF